LNAAMKAAGRGSPACILKRSWLRSAFDMQCLYTVYVQTQPTQSPRQAHSQIVKDRQRRHSDPMAPWGATCRAQNSNAASTSCHAVAAWSGIGDASPASGIAVVLQRASFGSSQIAARTAAASALGERALIVANSRSMCGSSVAKSQEPGCQPRT
jgi:hypothetical protein